MLATVMPSESVMAQEKSYVTYMLPSPLNDTCTRNFGICESRALISALGTTGLRTWEGALHLANYLMTSTGTKHVQNKVVLELGAGTGLIALLCAKFLHAKRVIATDGVASIVEEMRETIDKAGLEMAHDIECKRLTWGWSLRAVLSDEQGQWQPIDIVLGADIVSTWAQEIMIK